MLGGAHMYNPSLSPDISLPSLAQVNTSIHNTVPPQLHIYQTDHTIAGFATQSLDKYSSFNFPLSLVIPHQALVDCTVASTPLISIPLLIPLVVDHHLLLAHMVAAAHFVLQHNSS